MQVQAITHHGSSSSSRKQVSRLLQSCCMAALGFIIAVLFHQLLVGIISIVLGYNTNIRFDKVISNANDSRNWSSTPIIVLYAVPSIILLSMSVFLMNWVVSASRQIKNWYLGLFWFIAFSVLYVTAEITISPIAAIFSRGATDQGVSEIVMWFRLPLYSTVVLVLLAAITNLVFAYFGFKILSLYRPSSTDLSTKQFHRQIVLTNFLYPLLILVPLVFILSQPDSWLLFGVLLLCGLTWIPGFIICTHYIRPENKRKRIRRITPTTASCILFSIVLLTAAMRLFL